MKKLVHKSAGITNVIAKPLKNLILHNSRRTRILVRCGDEILLVKSSLSSQKWSLPGGGLKKNEDVYEGALRELWEETGLRLKKSQLKFLDETTLPKGKKWPQMNMIFYFAKLSQKVEPHIIRPLEIIDVQWFSLSDLPKELSPTVSEGFSLLKSNS